MLEDSQSRSPWAPNFTNVDLHDPANFGDGPPYEAFEALRNNAPVAFHPEVPRRHGGKQGPGFWCITKHRDVQFVSKDPETFSSWLGGFTGADLSGVVLEETRLNMMGMVGAHPRLTSPHPNNQSLDPSVRTR